MEAKLISEIEIVLRDRMSREMYQRAGRALDYLISTIQQAYRFKVNTAGGAVGAISGELRKAKNTLDMLIGTTNANKYLANLEFGEKGTKGGPSDAPFQRRKAPPIRNIYEWIRLAALVTPQRYVKRAERMAAIAARKKKPKKFDTSKPWYSVIPEVQWAFAIAMRRKFYGREGLHVIEKVATAQANKLKLILQGT
jgi:hypothetical protein